MLYSSPKVLLVTWNIFDNFDNYVSLNFQKIKSLEAAILTSKFVLQVIIETILDHETMQYLSLYQIPSRIFTVKMKVDCAPS